MFDSGRVQIHKAEPQASSSKSEELGEVDVGPKKPALQKKSWAGYLHNKYHPKSVSQTLVPFQFIDNFGRMHSKFWFYELNPRRWKGAEKMQGAGAQCIVLLVKLKNGSAF